VALRLGRELHAFRVMYRLTQDEIARVIGASSAASISQWEAGHEVPEGMRRERLRELLDGQLWPELRASVQRNESFPGPWREAVRWYRRASREVLMRATWGVPISRFLDSLCRAEDLETLRRTYVEAGPVGSAVEALTGSYAGGAKRQVEDAACGLRWLEITHGLRFDPTKSLARGLPLGWLNELCAK